MTDPMRGRKFGDIPAGERMAIARRAMRQLEAELRANADHISQIMNAAEAGTFDEAGPEPVAGPDAAADAMRVLYARITGRVHPEAVAFTEDDLDSLLHLAADDLSDGAREELIARTLAGQRDTADDPVAQAERDALMAYACEYCGAEVTRPQGQPDHLPGCPEGLSDDDEGEDDDTSAAPDTLREMRERS